jgi:3-dehydroquinate synthase
MERLKLRIDGVRDYEILIGQNANLAELLPPRPHYIAVVDAGLEVDLPFEVIKLPVKGEECKSWSTLEWLCDEILARGVRRDTCLVAVGGGSVGDLVGFAASIILRGIDFIQVPTTLLSMVDSSVGGKTAINTGKLKNMLGTFYQPKMVICSVDFLQSLPYNEFISGYAEVLKYGMIWDADFYKILVENELKLKQRDGDFIAKIIKRSCEIKAQIVGLDEKETLGIRALLNFGHTFGHAVEKLEKIPHGNAVAIGMLMGLKFSHELGLALDIKADELALHYDFLGLPKTAKSTANEILNLMAFDKKNTQKSHINLILLERLGKAVLMGIETEEIYKFLLNYL